MNAANASPRPFWIRLHRWSGLSMAGFLIIAGLTGSVLAFEHELERVFAPQLFAIPKPGVAKLDLATLAERAQTLVPNGRVVAVTLTDPDQVNVAFSPRRDPRTGRTYDLGFTEFYQDPWTGAELGRRTRADLSQGLINLMPFVYELHWRLAAGGTGQWMLGIVAMMWTLDCFVGFYLTLPRSRRRFWRRWTIAWRVKARAPGFRLGYELHRAAGLMVWPMLFIFAWSSVAMNIRPLYELLMKSMFDYQSPTSAYSLTAHPNASPRLDWRAAQLRGEYLLAEAEGTHRFRTRERISLMYDSYVGAYRYEVRGSRDLFERAPQGGGTAVMLDGDTGALRSLHLPRGEHRGNTVESWLYALHMARVFGRPYQIFVCLLGLITAALSVTGVFIWVKKRHMWSRRRS